MCDLLNIVYCPPMKVTIPDRFTHCPPFAASPFSASCAPPLLCTASHRWGLRERAAERQPERTERIPEADVSPGGQEGRTAPHTLNLGA
jgi:hypothetical protein